MSLIILGINHKTAPLDIREKVVFHPDQQPLALSSLLTIAGIQEAAILSTCNRTEVYCFFTSDEKPNISDWLKKFHKIEHLQLETYVYKYEEKDAVKHLLRVACGLDSLVLGEPQILGQLKQAYQVADDVQSLGTVMRKLFHHAFSVAKQVRTDTEIGSNPISVAFAAVTLARQLFETLEDKTALMIGAGETIELAVRHLCSQKLKKLYIANRNLERAQNLAEIFHGKGIALSYLHEYLPEADIIIASTASPVPILGKGAVETAIKKRKHRPMFMIDLAVPRDIEEEVGSLRDVYLYAVDDLEKIVIENRKSRQEAAQEAETIIENQIEHFMSWLKGLSSVYLIRSYRDKAYGIRQEILEKAQKRLQQGKDPNEVLAYLAHTLTNKLIHDASVQMRHAAEQEQKEILQTAKTLLKL